MRQARSLRPFSVALVLAITLPLIAPGQILADDGDLHIQDLSGKEIMKRRILSAALTGAWNLGKQDACNKLTERLSRPGDYSAYDVRCQFGSDVQVTAAGPLADGFLLTANVSRSKVNAEFTQPLAGKWADPSVEISWDSRLTVKVKFTEDGTRPGSPGTLPWFHFEDASLEMVSTDVDVDSTAADVIGGIVGFFGGFLFSGAGSVPLAIAGALGTSAVIDGIAKDQVPSGPFKFADQANSEFNKQLSPCDLVSAFGDLKGRFQPKSISSRLVVLSATNEAPPALAFAAKKHCASTYTGRDPVDLAGAWNDGGLLSTAVFLSDGARSRGRRSGASVTAGGSTRPSGPPGISTVTAREIWWPSGIMAARTR